MAGTRDTEMAIGAWQPHFQGHNPFGDVHIFRFDFSNVRGSTLSTIFFFGKVYAGMKKLGRFTMKNIFSNLYSGGKGLILNSAGACRNLNIFGVFFFTRFSFAVSFI